MTTKATTANTTTTKATTTIRTRSEYLGALRAALEGSDPALVQDALFDADEFLRSEGARLTDTDDEGALVARAIEEFGSPDEVASSYRDVDRRLARSLSPATPVLGFRPLERIFGVLVDPRAFGALFFMLLSLITGIVYFTWSIVGLAMSLGFSVLIFGAPLFIVFAASLRILSLTEGRLIETLLGVRMPRRSVPGPNVRGLWPRVRFWLTDRRTWTSVAYFVLKLPLGVISFVIATVFLSLSLALFLIPLAQPFVDFPLLQVLDHGIRLPWWSFPFVWGGALVDLLLVLHVARGFARLQAAMAKGMLVDRS